MGGGSSAKRRGKGAAPRSSKRSPPATAALAGAAPESPPDADAIDRVVAELRTEVGRERAYAELKMRTARGSLTRDAVSALTLEKHIIDRFSKAANDRELPDKVERLEAELAAVTALLAGGGKSRFADEVTEPPAVDDEALPS